MNKGKVTCEKLKAIRREVAEKLGIEYSPKECTFEGDCLGTCPLCQQETDMLMEQVRIRLEERPELFDEIQCKVSEMYQIDADKEEDDTIILEGMPIQPLQGLVDIEDEPLEEDVIIEDMPIHPTKEGWEEWRKIWKEEFDTEPTYEQLAEMISSRVTWGLPPLPAGIPPVPYNEEVEALSNYQSLEGTLDVDRETFQSIEQNILHNESCWDSILSADDPKLAFEELFIEILCKMNPNSVTHLLQVFFADHPTYKKQLMAIVMSIKKGQR